MEPSPTPRAPRPPLVEASSWFGWSLIAVPAALFLEGVVSQMRPDSYTLTGGEGDCMGMGSRSGALAACVLIGFCAFAYRRRGPRALWASILLAECFRFVPCLAMAGYATTAIPMPPGAFTELMNTHSVIFWWTTLSLTAVLATTWALLRRPGPGVAPLAASALGAGVTLAACVYLFVPGHILPWGPMVSSWVTG